MENEKLREAMLDAMISVAGKHAIDDEFFDDCDTGEHGHTFSKRFEHKMKRLIRRNPQRHLFTKTLRFAVSFVAAMSVTFVTAFACVPAFRQAVARTVMRLTDEYAAFGGASSALGGGSVMLPDYIPKGYVIESYFDRESSLDVVYRDADGKKIIYSCMPIDDGFGLSIDAEGAVISDVEIGIYAGRLFETGGPQKISSVVFEDGMTIFYISGEMDGAQAVKIAASILSKNN